MRSIGRRRAACFRPFFILNSPIRSRPKNDQVIDKELSLDEALKANDEPCSKNGIEALTSKAAALATIPVPDCRSKIAAVNAVSRLPRAARRPVRR